MNILVIESFPPMAKALKGVFEQLGHQVTVVTEVNQEEKTAENQEKKTIVNAVTVEGAQIILSDSQFELALVGNFEDVVEYLVEAGTVCVGMATMPNTNEKAKELGAVMAFNKAAVFVALVNSLVKVEDLVANTQETRQRLEEYQSQMNTDAFKALRRKGDELVAKNIG